jgi:hypothetical protein
MKSYGLGWRLAFAAGFFPAIAGFAMLGLGLWSTTLGRNDPWNSLVGEHSFSAALLSRSSPDLYSLLVLTVHLCGVNLAMSGITISAVAWFALRDGRAWAFPFLWFLLLWVGLNDTVALILYRINMGRGIPFALIPVALALTGLVLYRSEQKRLTSPEIADPPRFCDQRFDEGGNWVSLPAHDGFAHRYLRGLPVVTCETIMTTSGTAARAIELLRGPWDWWDRGRTDGFELLKDGSTDQVLVPVSWYWAHVRMRIFPPVELKELSGWRIPMKFAGSFNGSASIDVYPSGTRDQIRVRGRFHEVIENVPGPPHDFVTECHLRAESGILPFPFPSGTGWLGLRRRLAAGL